MRGLTDAFPVQGEEHWRKAAEAALKGRPLDALTSLTSDGAPLGPLHAGRVGPRAARGDGGPWRVLARADHPRAGDVDAQALEDLAGGADGLEVVFAGATSAFGFGLSRWDATTLQRAFEGVRLEGGPRFELDLGPDAAAQSAGFAALVTRPEEADVSFGLDPIGTRARSGRATRPWEEEARAVTRVVAELAGAGFAGPFLAADGRPIHAAGGTPAQELAFVLASATAYIRALDDSGVSLDQARSRLGFRMAADADQYATLANSARCDCFGRGSRRPAASRPVPPAYMLRARGG